MRFTLAEGRIFFVFFWRSGGVPGLVAPCLFSSFECATRGGVGKMDPWNDHKKSPALAGHWTGLLLVLFFNL